MGESRLARSESGLSNRSNVNSAVIEPTSLECQKQIPLLVTPGDEHADVQDDESKNTSPSESNSDSTKSEVSANTSGTETAESKDESSETSQSSSSGSSVGHYYPGQSSGRSPSISPPSPTRPVGHMAGNLKLFMTITKFTEGGKARRREGMG